VTDDRCLEMHLLMQADLDGELSPAEAARVAAHLPGCPECRAVQQRLSLVSNGVRAAAPIHRAPQTLRHSVQDIIAAEAGRVRPAEASRARRTWPRRSSFATGLSFGGGFALAACLALAIVLPSSNRGLTDAVVSDHIRSLQPGHLMDVISTDQHTVKPWFNGRLAFAPTVKDFRSEGFPLAGGRLDYLDGKEVAALVYYSGKHVIQLFVWPSGSDLDHGNTGGHRSGYNFIRWSRDGMAYWAVSDLNATELNKFVRLWQGT
jgi:anti-sigma factor RsiW